MAKRASYSFPDPERANAAGVVTVGGPFNAERLLAAYRCGIFPWCGDPVQWCSPDPRAVFLRIHLPSRLGKTIRHHKFNVSFDCVFDDVLRACAATHAERDEGTWITDEFIAGYGELHRRGHAHSVEIWQDDALVGGLYGVQVGGLFAGESMFFRVPNASKVAFAALVHQLRAIGTVLLDGQVLNPHTYRLGAVPVRRVDYLQMLAIALTHATEFNGKVWPPEGPAIALGKPSLDIPVRYSAAR